MSLLATQPPGILAAIVGLAALGALLLLGRARKAAHDTGRAVSLLGRTVFGAALIVGVQWMVLTRTSDTTLHVVVLAVPAMLAAALVTRALTITTTTVKRGGRR
jgi:hypothetical protein